MGRHKEFDRGEVLKSAMLLFWERGYEAASVQNCLDAMGISRSSMYEEFGGKYGLLISALEFYGDTVVQRYMGDFERLNGMAAIYRYFYVIISNTDTLDGRTGCFIQNMVLERRAFSAEFERDVARKVAILHKRVEDCLHRALVQAEEAEEIKKQDDPRQTARFLFTIGQGLIVMGKAENAKTLTDSADYLFALLDSWRVSPRAVKQSRTRA